MCITKYRMNVILDTNILLHYKSFEEIPWQEELGCGEVTIVLTAIVLEEIDNKKDQEKGKIQKRARTVSSRLKDILIAGKPSKYPVVFVESAFSTEEEKRCFHLDRNDNQILFDVKQSGLDKVDVTIVSSDTAMLLRARQFGFKIFQPDDKYLLKEELSNEEKEARAAIKELERVKNRMPEPKLVFDGGVTHIRIRRVDAVDIEEELNTRINELFRKWPEKTLEDEQEVILGQVYNRVSQEMILQYNITRNKFIEQSEKKIRLEVERDEFERRMKRVSIMLVNSGTASTGKMNVFVEVPSGVKLYEEGSRKKVTYDEPSTPNYYGMYTIPSFNLMTGFYKPSVEMWNMDDFIRAREMKKVFEPLTHNLQQEAFAFFVDSATCPNFKMMWIIADAALSDPMQGVLNVSFIEE